jgi:Domain of unknown function (DUF4926)
MKLPNGERAITAFSHGIYQMTTPQPQLLDTVATLSPLTRDRLVQVELDKVPSDGLPMVYDRSRSVSAGEPEVIGLIGTVVEVYSTPPTYLVEFADGEGREYAMAILPATELLVVHLELTPGDPNLVAA